MSEAVVYWSVFLRTYACVYVYFSQPPHPQQPCAFRLRNYEEVFTSEHWMVRIYRVLPEKNRQPRLPNPHRVSSKTKRKTKKRTLEGTLQA